MSAVMGLFSLENVHTPKPAESCHLVSCLLVLPCRRVYLVVVVDVVVCYSEVPT